MFIKTDLLMFLRIRKKKQYIKTSTDIDHRTSTLRGQNLAITAIYHL